MNFLDRQANIYKFNTDPGHTIFLLSTRYVVKKPMIIIIIFLFAELVVLGST